MNAKTFRAAFGERFGIRNESYEERVLWACIYPHRHLAGKVLWWLNRRLFAPDLELIRAVADCTSTGDVRAEVDDFRYHQPPRGFLRRTLRLRLSGQRLVDTAARVLK